MAREWDLKMTNLIKTTETIVSLSIALGVNDKIAEDIHQLFLENEMTYRSIIKEGKKAGELEYAKTFSLQYIYPIEKAYAIVVNTLQGKNTNAALKKLVKKGYPSLYRKIEQASHPLTKQDIDNKEGREVYVKASSREIICSYGISAYFIAFEDATKFEHAAQLSMNQYIEACIKDMQYELEMIKEVVDYKSYPPTEEERKMIAYLYENYTVKKQFNLNTFSYSVISNIKTSAQKKIDNKEYLKLSPKEYSEFRRNQRQQVTESINKPIKRIVTLVDDILKRFGFHENQNTYRLSEKETKKLFILTAKYYQETRLASEPGIEIEMILLGMVNALRMRKEYEEAQSLYFEATSVELETKMKERYEQKINSLEKEKMSLERKALNEAETIASLKEQLKNAKESIVVQEKELRKVSSWQENYEDLQQEAVALRNFSYDVSKKISKDVDIPNEEAFSDMLTFLKNKRIIIVGGSVKWQKNLKEYLPDVTFIAIDKNNSYAALKAPGNITVINTLANKHANYRKLLSMRNKDNPICYFNVHTNMRLSIQSIYENIKAIS